MVLLSHGRHFLTPVWKNAASFRVGGFLGVELFFVLSGFLIGGIAWQNFKQVNQERSWISRFLLRRWFRTLPNYYLFLTVNGILIFLSVIPGQIGDLLPFLIFSQNFAWPGPAIFGEAWSLSVEEIFYFIFPISLLLFEKTNLDRKNIFITVTFLLILAPLLGRILAVANFAPRWDDGIRKVVIFRLDALMVGVLTGWLLKEYNLLRKFRPILLVPATLITIAASAVIFFTLEPTINESQFARIWLFPFVSVGFALAMISGLSWSSPMFLLNKVMEKSARWSYALYLVHMPVFHLIVHFIGPTPADDELGAMTRWLLFIVTSVLLAAATERYFEHPILEWRDRNIRR